MFSVVEQYSPFWEAKLNLLSISHTAVMLLSSSSFLFSLSPPPPLWHLLILKSCLLLIACSPGLTQGPRDAVLHSQHRGAPAERGIAL